jgi:dolichol-phosphate mannosyltransferase
LLSIVVPLYNEAEALPHLRARLSVAAERMECPVELIFVDDGSSDQSLPMLQEWASKDPRVSVVSLARNFGHQSAATAGLDQASGDGIVLMDADLQDPPELILDLLAEYRRGFDVVYAQRIRREGESAFKKVTAWAYYRLMRIAVDRRLPSDTGDYRLISRACLDALLSMRETHRFLRGMVAWVGFRQTAVQFVRPPRVAGETKYPLGKMIRFAWTAILSFSPLPLRTIFAFGFVVAGVGFAAGTYALAANLLGFPVVPGWTSLMLTICLIGSFILIALGVIGEYVAKIYEEVKGRPLYVIDPSQSRRLKTR